MLSREGICQTDSLLIYEVKRHQLLTRKGILEDSITKMEVRITQIRQSKSDNSIVQLYVEGISLMEAKVKDKPDVFGYIVGIVPKDAFKKIFGYTSSYFVVEYDTIKGYLSEAFLKPSSKLDSFRAVRRLNNKHDEILEEYGFSVGSKILNHEYWIGMTSKQAALSLGLAKNVNKSVGSYGIHEQWVYSDKYLYFKNGVLTSFQVSLK